MLSNYVLVLCAVVVTVSAQHFHGHQPVALAVEQKQPKDIVVKEINDNDGTGYFYTFRQMLDGSSAESRGYLDAYGKQVIEGTFTEIDYHGQPKTTHYVADSSGYHPVGAHLPRA